MYLGCRKVLPKVLQAPKVLKDIYERLLHSDAVITSKKMYIKRQVGAYINAYVKDCIPPGPPCTARGSYESKYDTFHHKHSRKKRSHSALGEELDSDSESTRSIDGSTYSVERKQKSFEGIP